MAPMDVTLSINWLMCLPHAGVVGVERPQGPSSDAPHYHLFHMSLPNKLNNE
jgi:hypothetical protein